MKNSVLDYIVNVIIWRILVMITIISAIAIACIILIVVLV